MKSSMSHFVDGRYREALLAPKHGPAHLVRKRIEEWTCNLGSRQFLRILMFENGGWSRCGPGDRGFVEGQP